MRTRAPKPPLRKCTEYAVHRHPPDRFMNHQNYASTSACIVLQHSARLPSRFDSIRTTMRLDQPWFVLSDTLEAMGMKVPDTFRTPASLDIDDPSLVVELLEEDRSAAYLVAPEGGQVVASLISEPELYALIQSRPASHYDSAKIRPSAPCEASPAIHLQEKLLKSLSATPI